RLPFEGARPAADRPRARRGSSGSRWPLASKHPNYGRGSARTPFYAPLFQSSMKYTILVAALFATFVGSVAFAQDGGEARDILSEIASAAFAPPTAQSHPADAFLTSPANPADMLRSADESHAAFDDRKVSGGKAFVLSLLL